MKPSLGIILTSIIWFISCSQNIEWSEQIPDNFQGQFVQVDVYDQENPVSLKLGSDYIEIRSYDFDGQIYSDRFPIRKVSITADELIVFCGEPNDDHIAEHRYLIFWKDNLLHLSRVFTPWGPDNPEYIELGKFKIAPPPFTVTGP